MSVLIAWPKCTLAASMLSLVSQEEYTDGQTDGRQTVTIRFSAGRGQCIIIALRSVNESTSVVLCICGICRTGAGTQHQDSLLTFANEQQSQVGPTLITGISVTQGAILRFFAPQGLPLHFALMR